MVSEFCCLEKNCCQSYRAYPWIFVPTYSVRALELWNERAYKAGVVSYSDDYRKVIVAILDDLPIERLVLTHLHSYSGDLYSRDPYTEEEAARISSSILSAIAYMHSKNIIHRDLKYENILFANTSPKAEIKLIDFGLSAAFGQDALTDGVGTM